MLPDYKGVKVFVTGHSGFKGSWLATWLVESGADVAGLSLPPPEGRPSLFLDAEISTRMNSKYGDIKDLLAVESAIRDFNPDIVFHLAAQPLVRASYREPIETFGSNIMGTANVLEACRSVSSVKAVVCITTDKCYHNNEWCWGYRENDRLGGKDPYSASKAAAEIIAASYRQSLLREEDYLLATARGGNVVGGGDWSIDRLVPDLVEALRRGDNLIVRYPNAIRPWQHVLELVRGYLILGDRLLKGDRTTASAYNFGPGRENEVNVLNLAEGMLKRWGNTTTKITLEPSSIFEAGFLKLDSSKAESELGWRPKLSWDQTLDFTMHWYKDYIKKMDSAYDLMKRDIARYQGSLS